MVAIPAPIIIRTNPNASARHACHKHLEVIFPRTICTFHDAPEAGHARLTGPNEIFRRLCHFAATPRAYILCVSNHQTSTFDLTFCSYLIQMELQQLFAVAECEHSFHYSLTST